MLHPMVKLPGFSELGRSLNNCPRRLPRGCTSARARVNFPWFSCAQLCSLVPKWLLRRPVQQICR